MEVKVRVVRTTQIEPTWKFGQGVVTTESDTKWIVVPVEFRQETTIVQLPGGGSYTQVIQRLGAFVPKKSYAADPMNGPQPGDFTEAVKANTAVLQPLGTGQQ